MNPKETCEIKYISVILHLRIIPSFAIVINIIEHLLMFQALCQVLELEVMVLARSHRA